LEHPLLHTDSIDLADVAGAPYTMLSVDEANQTASRYWAPRRLDPNVIFTTSSVEAVRSMVADGLGLTILSEMVYRPWSLEGQRIEQRNLLTPIPTMDVGLPGARLRSSGALRERSPISSDCLSAAAFERSQVTQRHCHVREFCLRETRMFLRVYRVETGRLDRRRNIPVDLSPDEDSGCQRKASARSWTKRWISSVSALVAGVGARSEGWTSTKVLMKFRASKVAKDSSPTLTFSWTVE
jgi:hypothetical protein